MISHHQRIKHSPILNKTFTIISQYDPFIKITTNPHQIELGSQFSTIDLFHYKVNPRNASKASGKCSPTKYRDVSSRKLHHASSALPCLEGMMMQTISKNRNNAAIKFHSNNKLVKRKRLRRMETIDKIIYSPSCNTVNDDALNAHRIMLNNNARNLQSILTYMIKDQFNQKILKYKCDKKIEHDSMKEIVRELKQPHCLSLNKSKSNYRLLE